jgi:hypothetical protein
VRSFRGPAREKGQVKLENVLSAYSEFQFFLASCNETDKEILHIFQLDVFEDPTIWGAFWGEAGASVSKGFMEATRSIYHIEEFLGRFVALLASSDDEEVNKTTSTTSLIEFYIRESEKDDLIPLSLMLEVLRAVSDLFDEISALENEESKEVLLWKIDSGSKKYFSILAGKKAIKELKDTIIDVWDRIRFFEAKNFEANARSAIEGCKLIEKIHELEKKGVITNGQGEKSKKLIIKNLRKLFENGVYIDEMSQRDSSLTVKQIAGRGVKLIEHKTSPIDKTDARYVDIDDSRDGDE